METLIDNASHRKESNMEDGQDVEESDDERVFSFVRDDDHRGYDEPRMLARRTLSADFFQSTWFDRKRYGCATLMNHVMPLAVPFFTIVVMNIVRAASFGQLLFPPELEDTLNNLGMGHSGTSIFLLSTISGQLAVILFSGMPFAIAGGSLELLPMYASLSLAVYEKLHETASDQIVVSTTLMVFAITNSILAISYVLSATFGIGSFLRMTPLSVLKGALAGVSVFLIKSALEQATGHALNSLHDVSWLMHHSRAMIQISIGTCLGITLYVVDVRLRSPFAYIAFILTIAVVLNLVPFVGHTRKEMIDENWFYSDGSESTGNGTLSSTWYSTYHQFHVDTVQWSTIPPLLPRIFGIILTHQLITVTDLVNIEAVRTIEVHSLSSSHSRGCAHQT